MSIKGTLWYQGESNVGAAKAYACLFPAMIDSWRTNFGQDFGFYFVMLAPWTNYPGDISVPELQESQESALALPEVGMAVATDLGDIDSPYGNIHPREPLVTAFNYKRWSSPMAETYKQMALCSNQLHSIQYGGDKSLRDFCECFLSLRNSGTILEHKCGNRKERNWSLITNWRGDFGSVFVVSCSTSLGHFSAQTNVNVPSLSIKLRKRP